MSDTLNVFPRPTWVDLRMAIEQGGQSKSKLVAQFDPVRGLLRVVERQQEKTFDLCQIIYESKIEK